MCDRRAVEFIINVEMRVFHNAKALVISELFFASVSKRVFVRNHPYENVFCLLVHFQANQTRLDIKCFAHFRVETEARGNSEVAN